MKEWGGTDHTELFLKRSVCEAVALGGCIHVVGVVEGDREHSRLEVVEVRWGTSPEAAEESPKRCWQACQVNEKVYCSTLLLNRALVGKKVEGLESRRLGSNHSRAIPLRYDCAKTTLVRLVRKALGQS